MPIQVPNTHTFITTEHEAKTEEFNQEEATSSYYYSKEHARAAEQVAKQAFNNDKEWITTSRALMAMSLDNKQVHDLKQTLTEYMALVSLAEKALREATGQPMDQNKRAKEYFGCKDLPKYMWNTNHLLFCKCPNKMDSKVMKHFHKNLKELQKTRQDCQRNW